MKALDRKLLRDLRGLWSQALTIALVVASGIGGYIACLSAVDSLAAARDDFYASGQFAQVFAQAKRAPQATAALLRQLPGVADVAATVEAAVRLELPASRDPAIGQLIGLDAREPLRINRVTLRYGRMPVASLVADGALEALVSEGFAQAHQLKPGDQVRALINGKRRALTVVGVALSPEYIFAGLFGMPDLRGFGVFWVDRDLLAAATGMTGAFNRVAIRLAPGASVQDVIASVTRTLAPWGGLLAHGRDAQTSHQMLNNEIKEQRVMGTVLPAIFLAVAVFLLNVVVSRLVATQREQIAALKALGYTGAAIAIHYLKLVLLIVLAGLALGVLVGDWLGAGLTGLYAEFFHFPRFTHRIATELLVVSGLVTLVTATLGTLNATHATLRLAPAEAMRPPAPGHYRRTMLERLGITAISPALRMILRNMERRPLRTGLTITGVAAAVAIVIMGNFFRDAIEEIIDTSFTLSLRGDLTVWLTEPVAESASRELARLPGVRQVESGRSVPVLLVNGWRSERTSIQGRAAVPQLNRIIDMQRHQVLPGVDGLVLTDRLADKLGLRLGDRVQVQVLDGRRGRFDLPVVATAQEMMGLNAYMERQSLNRLLGDGDLASQFALQVQRGSEAAVLDATRQMPAVAGAFSKATMLRSMQEMSARNVRIMSTILTAFATVIAIGVVYNNARIALAERSWELASLRVLGFSRGEVSMLLLGELAIGIALALPLGMLMGWSLTHVVVGLLKSDQFNFPVIILPRTYAWAAICVVAAGLASALVVRRHIDRLDLVAALKTRE